MELGGGTELGGVAELGWRYRVRVEVRSAEMRSHGIQRRV